MEYWIKIGLTTTMLVVISGQNGTAHNPTEGCRTPIQDGIECPGGKKCPVNGSCDDLSECTCMDGYKSHTHKVGIQIIIDCDDINECNDNLHKCGAHTRCNNTVGAYFCICDEGFRKGNDTEFCPTNNTENICSDIDECEENPNLCGPNQICKNKAGSYKCVCQSGFLNISNQCTVQCKNENPPTCNDPGHECRLRTFIESYKPLCNDSGPGKLNMSKLLDDLEDLISKVNISDKIQRLNMSGQLLNGVEGVIQNLAYLFHDRMPVYNKNNFISAKMVNSASQDKILLRNKNSSLQMAAKTALGDAYTSVVGCLEYGNVGKLSKLLEGAELLNDTQNLTVKLVSPVVSVFIGTGDTTYLSEPIELQLNITKEAKPEKALCAFWSVEDRAWSTEGCETLNRTQNGVVCSCNHLTSFAVLMALDKIESWALDLITKIGLSISIVCLAVAILTFCFCRFLRGTRNTIHIHLCVCLLLGHIIFLTGIDSASNKALCRIVAGLLHFFYLSTFCWMSLEGLELYLMLVTVFKTQVKTRYLLAVGYGVPTVIIAISAAVKPDGYGTKEYCWLSLDGSFIWSFMGPVCAIILVNCGIFVLTVWKLAEKMTTINPEQGKLKRIRTLTVTSIAQLCILGCCWAFGFLMFGKSSLFFAYAFTICNVLQGVQIFFLHCLMNKKVRETYANAICAIAHFRSPLYSEFSNSTNMHTQSKAKTSKESGL